MPRPIGARSRSNPPKTYIWKENKEGNRLRTYDYERRRTSGATHLASKPRLLQRGLVSSVTT